jgi:hypothetical protein
LDSGPTIFRVSALFLLAVACSAARAESVPFKCELRDEGRTVQIFVSNPSREARSCLVSCRFSPLSGGSDTQIMCAHMVPGDTVEAAMCAKDSGGVTFVKQTHGAADCSKP